MTLREGADHCAVSAFPYLYYRQPCADCQAPQYSRLNYLPKSRFQRRADMHRAALLFVGFYGILLAERRCPTKRRRLLLLTGLAVLLFGAKQAREGNFLEFHSRRSRRREGCLMTTSEILLLFQTIIALLALLVSVVHLMDDRKKDDSYGSKRKKHKKK